MRASSSGLRFGCRKADEGWKEKNWKEEKRSVCISYEELGNTCRLRNMKMVITVAAGMIFAGPRLYSDGIGKKYRPCRVLDCGSGLEVFLSRRKSRNKRIFVYPAGKVAGYFRGT